MPHTYLHTYTTTAQLCPSGSPDKNATDVTAQRSYYYCLFLSVLLVFVSQFSN